MSLRVLLAAGETRVLTNGGSAPVEAVLIAGPGAALVEGVVVRPESAWGPDGLRLTHAVVTAVDDTTVEVR